MKKNSLYICYICGRPNLLLVNGPRLQKNVFFFLETVPLLSMGCVWNCSRAPFTLRMPSCNTRHNSWTTKVLCLETHLVILDWTKKSIMGWEILDCALQLSVQCLISHRRKLNTTNQKCSISPSRVLFSVPSSYRLKEPLSALLQVSTIK